MTNSPKGAQLKAAAAALPPESKVFNLIIELAFPPHDDDAKDDVFSEVFDDADLNAGCQCRECQVDRGELEDIPEPIVYEIFY